MNASSPATAVAEHPAAVETIPALKERLISLDVFRGITIVGMILVNNPGTWSAVYPPLLHAKWHGWTPTDLIFPFFLFIVGVAIVLAFQKRLARGVSRGTLISKTFKRSLILFGLGLFLAAFPVVTFVPEFGLHPQLFSLRIMGVLQRIAVCYLAASLIFLYARPGVQMAWAWGLALVYWFMMELIPVPGYGAGLLDNPEGTLAAYIDRLFLGGHLWEGANYRWDPEGLLSTLPAISTTLFGVWTGRLLLADEEPSTRTVRMFVRGSGLVVLGYVWNWFFPINKSIWTSSYAVFTAGLAVCGLALCYWFIDVRGYKRWTTPFVVYGVNAITVYVLSGLLGRLLTAIEVPSGNGESFSLQSYLFEHVFLPLASPINASLLYALTWITGWFIVLYWMYRKRIFLKV